MSDGVDNIFQIEEAKIEIPMPKAVLNVTLTATQGKYTFDPVSKLLAWDIGKVDPQKPPNIHGTVSLQACVDHCCGASSHYFIP